MADTCLPDFVSVAESGTHFEVNGAPFFFAGCNSYMLMTRAADPNLRHEVTEVLDAARKADLAVVRTWAFCDGPEWNALQPEAGVFDERVFAALDWVIAQAKMRGLRLCMPLVNYWPAYGGIPQYMRWSCQRQGAEESGSPEEFYQDRCCQDIFQNFLATITSRVNTITGIAYRDEPAIMAWELMNEPRCSGDFSGSKLQHWIDRTAEFLKSVDPNHMVTVGTEGFFGSSTPEFLPDNPYDTLSEGCDFARNHMPDNIDYATIHLWPDTWLSGGQCSEEAALRFARRWINAHVDCCTRLGKPLVLTEFGKKPAGPPRATFYQKVYDTAFGNALCGRPLGGILQWMVASGTYPDYDEFTCRIPGTEDPCGCPGADKAAVHTMLRFAQRFAALNRDRIIPVASL
ncbi:g4932 [Coccomyxa viridis]|uniref:mannan endo-1,4-beta-mannosidase n=1 Tax=Coccomyxa viridis TaxID=1274662 RepID=A0ABP1FSZ3_9CHLO